MQADGSGVCWWLRRHGLTPRCVASLSLFFLPQCSIPFPLSSCRVHLPHLNIPSEQPALAPPPPP